MTKIEEVARAIALDLGEDPDALDVLIQGREGKRPHWEGFESTARAAIEALRRINPAMERANGRYNALLPVQWENVIDAILSEGDGAKP